MYGSVPNYFRRMDENFAQPSDLSPLIDGAAAIRNGSARDGPKVMSAPTAIGNNYSYAEAFSRQLRGDALVGLSTSDNSEDVSRTMAAAREFGIPTIGPIGRGGGRLRAACDVATCVPANKTSHIREMQLAIGHDLCGFLEDAAC